MGMQNPFALILIACQKSLLEGKIAEDVLGRDRLIIAKALINCGSSHDRIMALLGFLKNFIYIKDQEINRIFDQIEQISGGTITMGVIEAIRKQEREEGERRGKLEGEYKKSLEIARNMKNEGMSLAQIMRFTKLSAEELKKL